MNVLPGARYPVTRGRIHLSRPVKPEAWPYAFVLVVFPSIYYVTLAHLRFRHPIHPGIIVLAAYGGHELFARTR
jgi:hypothetical protein